MILLAALTLALPARADDWAVLQVPGGFEVQMPGQAEPAAEGTWEGYNSEPLQAFAVEMHDMPAGTVASVGEEPMLVSSMKGRVEALGGRLIRARRILSDRLPGCRFEVETEDTLWEFMIRLRGDRIFTLSVSTLKSEPSPETAERFFNSFHVPY